MNTLEELENKYLKVVKRFVPSFEDKISQISYQIDLFLSENEEKYNNPRNFRIKLEGDIFSETLYDAARFESDAKNQEDDLYLPIDGPNLFVGFDYGA